MWLKLSEEETALMDPKDGISDPGVEENAETEVNAEGELVNAGIPLVLLAIVVKLGKLVAVKGALVKLEIVADEEV